MEERIIDDPRKIKVKKNAVGGIADATDELAPDLTEEALEEELFIELPEEEFDEELVGLTPKQLKEALEKRKEAEQEALKARDAMLAEGEAALKNGSFSEAEGFFIQTLVYDPDCTSAKEGVYLARTRHFKDLEPLYVLEIAQEIAESDDKTKRFIRKSVGERLTAQRKEYEAEAEPLAERVLGAQAARRKKFNSNRNYWLIWFTVVTLIVAAFAIAAGVSANYIYTTKSFVPIILIIVFAVLAFITLFIDIIMLRKVVQAMSFCRENNRLSSTEEGARLKYLQHRLLCLKLILDD